MLIESVVVPWAWLCRLFTLVLLALVPVRAGDFFTVQNKDAVSHRIWVYENYRGRVGESNTTEDRARNSYFVDIPAANEKGPGLKGFNPGYHGGYFGIHHYDHISGMKVEGKSFKFCKELNGYKAANKNDMSDYIYKEGYTPGTHNIKDGEKGIQLPRVFTIEKDEITVSWP